MKRWMVGTESALMSNWLSEYGQRRRWRWWGQRNTARVQANQIDDEAIETIEKKLARYDAQPVFLRFFQRLFTPIEKQRSLLCFWAVQTLQVKAFNVQPITHAIQIIGTHAHQSKSSHISQFFTQWQQKIRRVWRKRFNKASPQLEDSMLAKKLNNICATTQYVFKLLMHNPCLTTAERQTVMDEKLLQLQECYESLLPQAKSEADKEKLAELYGQQQAVLQQLQANYQELLKNPATALQSIQLKSFKRVKHDWSLYKTHLSQFFDEVIRLIGAIRPLEGYVDFRDKVRDFIQQSLLFALPPVLMGCQSDVAILLQEKADQLKRVDLQQAESYLEANTEVEGESVVDDWLKGWQDLLQLNSNHSPANTNAAKPPEIPSNSWALVKSTLTKSTSPVESKTNEATAEKLSSPEEKSLQQQFVADLQMLKEQGEQLLERARAAKQDPTPDILEMDEKQLQDWLGFKAFTKCYRENLKNYHPDTHHGTAQAEEASVYMRSWLETYQDYSQQFEGILEGKETSLTLLEQVMQGQSRNRAMQQENAIKLAKLAEEMKKMSQEFKQTIQKTDQMIQKTDQMIQEVRCMKQQVAEIREDQKEMRKMLEVIQVRSDRRDEEFKRQGEDIKQLRKQMLQVFQARGLPLPPELLALNSDGSHTNTNLGNQISSLETDRITTNEVYDLVTTEDHPGFAVCIKVS